MSCLETIKQSTVSVYISLKVLLATVPSFTKNVVNDLLNQHYTEVC